MKFLLIHLPRNRHPDREVAGYRSFLNILIHELISRPSIVHRNLSNTLRSTRLAHLRVAEAEAAIRRKCLFSRGQVDLLCLYKYQKNLLLRIVFVEP